MDNSKADSEKIEDCAKKSLESEMIENMEDQKLTRKVLFKLDITILPMLALLFLCSFLDRTNVGNAKIIGLESDINITDHQYDTGLAVFYLTYICSELPSNLALKKASPKIWLPLLAFLWGTMTMCLGFVKNYAGFIAVRAILGVTEGGLLPGMVLYLSSFYKRDELALRIGLFYTAASLSGAFGGLLARGLAEIAPRGGLEGWRWIFIIEGLMTVFCGILSFIALPNSIETASFLAPEERAFARRRLMQDQPLSRLEGSGGLQEEHETLRWSEVRRGILDIRMWLTATAYMAILCGLYSFGLFLPTIINGLGFAKNPNDAQLWSVIPYAAASVVTVICSIISDRLRLRGVIMLFVLPIAIVGYAVIANVHSEKVKYGMTFLMSIGMYGSIPCILVWNSSNSAGHYKRATTSAMQLAIANCGGFVATFIYPKREGPQYRKGHLVVCAVLAFAWCMILSNVLYCAKINRDKANGKYDQYAGYNDDRDPEFKMVL